MNDSKISVRYSRALIELAREKNILDKVYNDMLYIAEICRIKEVKEVLDSPIIIPSRKKSVLHGIMEGNVDKITLSLVDLLVKNGRESYLPAVTRVFRDDTLRIKGITETSLTTAVPVDESVRKKITGLVSSVFNTRVELKEYVDSDIIGGFILRVNDNYIDGSVRNKLRKIKRGLVIKPSASGE